MHSKIYSSVYKRLEKLATRGINGARKTSVVPCSISVNSPRPPKLSVAMYEKGKRPNFTICVEGNIGCGKTTFLKHFAKFNDVEVFEEPVEKWRNVRGMNLLDLMYKDPSRWSHLFQTYAQLTMLEYHLKPSASPVKLIERSIYSARHCFVENFYRAGTMSQAEYNVYTEWYKMITENLDTKVDLIVYLKTQPEIVYERIRSRCRNEEQMIPFEYIESLHNLHEEWLSHDESVIGAPVLVLNADDNLDIMKRKFEECAKEILGRRLKVSTEALHSPIKVSMRS